MLDPRTVVLKEDLLAMKDTARSSGSLFTQEPRLGRFVVPSHGFFVCTTCFSLTSMGLGMQRCSCEEYKAYPGIDCPSGYHLCYMCAATVVGGTSRYSWNACDSCLRVNRQMASKYGFSLPLGRHSLMNSISVPLRASQEVQEKAVTELLGFVKVAGAISDWGMLQARTLFETAPTFSILGIIPREKWEAKFELSKVKSTSRSVQAILDYLGISNFEELL
jgi:hypothetical protein